MEQPLLFKAKVIDEPDEWVIGELINNNTIFQKETHKDSKCCGCGQFTIEPNTLRIAYQHMFENIRRYKNG